MFVDSTYLHVATDTAGAGAGDEDNEAKRRASPVYILRMALNYGPSDIEARSGGKVDHRDVRAVELGLNKATSYRTSTGLSEALGLTGQQLRDLLDGRLSPEVARTLSTAPPKPEDEEPSRRKRTPRVIPGPSLAEVVASRPGEWTVEDVKAAEVARASDGKFEGGWEGVLNDVKSVRLARERGKTGPRDPKPGKGRRN
jgi:hypothetical protein